NDFSRPLRYALVVAKPRARSRKQPLREVKNFDDGVADAVVCSADDGGVGAGRQARQDRGFLRIIRRNAAVFDLGFLGLLPVIVRGDGGAVAVVELEGGIS